jgi:nicotinamide-nucleotide amidase
MKASLLTIGDELLIGQVLNSNAQWMSEQLTEIGCEVTRHLTVGDQKAEINQALDLLKNHSDVIIIGGGLGPTHDDITIETLSEYFGMPLEYNLQWLSKVEELFRSRNRVMTENNKKQAFLLSGATLIDNDCGTAAGQYFKAVDTRIFVVPGVPHEAKSMMKRFILPEIAKSTLGEGVKIRKETLVTIGAGESALATKLDGFVKKIQSLSNVTLAFLPNLASVRLRLQMKTRTASEDANFDALVTELANECGRDFVGFEPAKLESVVLEQLKSRNQTLAIAESCTGGLIAHKLTEIPGASKVLKGAIVAYQEAIKTSELGIAPDLISIHGVVSETIARAMAESIRQKWNTDYAIATTGYLGPEGGDANAKIGTVWIALGTPSGTEAHEFTYENNRERSKERAALTALDLLRRKLSSHPI